MTTRALRNITLEQLIEQLADLVIAKLGPKLTAKMSSPDELIDQKSAPCGREKFLRAARAGEFKSYRHGKSIFARRSEVEAWIEAGKVTEVGPRAPISPGATSEEDLALENDVRRSIGLKPCRLDPKASPRRAAGIPEIPPRTTGAPRKGGDRAG